MTIIEAIQTVLSDEGKPLTYLEIYNLIVSRSLYSFKAKNPSSIVNSMIRRHCYGLEFPTANKTKYFRILSESRGSSKYALYEETTLVNNENKLINSNKNDRDKLPEEQIYESLSRHKKLIQQELLDNILNEAPSFFEELVVELLLKMGYGWDRNKSGYVNGRVGDGGIDGIIQEDKLGLGKIYIQAKRYTDNSIGRPALQQFVGAMEHNIKGVFITTSTFTNEAKAYIAKQPKDIVLIDRDKLTSLLVENNIGIQIVQTFATYKVDKDYFE